MKKLLFIGLLLFIATSFVLAQNLLEEVKERYDDGKLKVVEYYKKVGDSKKLVQFIAYYENGQIEYEENYKNGKLNGNYIKYYENGITHVKGKYINGNGLYVILGSQRKSFESNRIDGSNLGTINGSNL